MTDPLRIKGGAGPFEAAVLAAVIDHVLQSERAARRRRPDVTPRPPAWVRAAQPRNPDDPLDIIYPDHRGDPL